MTSDRFGRGSRTSRGAQPHDGLEANARVTNARTLNDKTGEPFGCSGLDAPRRVLNGAGRRKRPWCPSGGAATPGALQRFFAAAFFLAGAFFAVFFAAVFFAALAIVVSLILKMRESARA